MRRSLAFSLAAPPLLHQALEENERCKGILTRLFAFKFEQPLFCKKDSRKPRSLRVHAKTSNLQKLGTSQNSFSFFPTRCRRWAAERNLDKCLQARLASA